MTTMADFSKSKLMTGPYTALRHAGADVGSVQIRSTATIGGNIANASPAGDIAPVLYLLDAEVIVVCNGTIRRLPISNILTDAGKASLKHNEVITGFFFPKKWSLKAKSAFCKLGYRKALTVSRIGLAMLLDFDSDGFITFARVVVGAIAPTPVHVERAEQFLIGKKPVSDVSKEVGTFLSELILEITPKEFDRDYKARAAFGIAEDIFALM
jgi:carbon-monoxide dehydrogenase medium subunit